ncbi:hypothetical protein MnTg02_01842 [bacterium MnTg02]|nr:hypothetical protein MnTg02_01842 [bacterium MnTg02]
MFNEHIADLDQRDGEVALPSGIPGVGLGQTFSDGPRGLVGGERVGEVALFKEHVTDLDVRDGEVALPSGISGIGLGQAFEDIV